MEAIDTAIALGTEPSMPNMGLNPDATPLHNAVCSGSLAAVRKLVEVGADAGAKDIAYQATPFQWAEYFARDRCS